MLFKRSDIHFSDDDAHQFLPWLMGVMMCLAALLLCFGIAINGWIDSRHSSYAASFTVNIPATIENPTQALAKIQETLRATKGVSNVAQLTHNELRIMLKPWLGASESLEGLPLPTVLNVTLSSADVPIDYKRLQKALSDIADGTEIDAHERWVQAFSDFSITAQTLIVIIACLIMSAMAAVVAFVSRASLHLHARTVHLLHSIGAEDDYIAKQFQRDVFWLVLPGTAAGCLAAMLVYWMIGMYMASFGVSLIPNLSIATSHVLLLLLLPFACSMAAWCVSSVSVRHQLRHTL